MNCQFNLLKITGIFLLFIILASCTEDAPRTTDNMYDFVAPNPALIIEIEDYTALKSTFGNQSFFKKNKSNALLKKLNFDAWERLIDIPKHTLATFHPLSKNEIAETLIFKAQDSLQLKMASTGKAMYDSEEIFVVDSGKKVYHYTTLAGHTIVSSSKIILENIIRNFKNEIIVPSSLSKLSSVLSDNTSSLIINTANFKDLYGKTFKDLSFMPFMGMTDYIGFDLIIDENDILLSGVVLESENTTIPWTAFSKVSPKTSIVAEVVPNSFTKVESVLISDYKELFEFDKIVNENLRFDSIWLGVDELAKVHLSNASAVIIVGENADDTSAYLNKRSKPLKSFGSFDINQLTTPLQYDENIAKYIKNIQFEYYTIIKDMVLGAQNLQTLEDIIIEINNNNVLALQPSFNYHLESLSAQSHMLWYTNLERSDIILENSLHEESKSDYKKLDWSKHEFLVSQMKVEDGFAYFNVLQRERKPEASYSKVEQLVRISPELPIISKPQFFKNWRTGQYDIVFQDSKNVLHLRDTKGNLIWSKALESPLVGKISTIDIYQNDRLQLTFATKDKIYVLDKNGNDVSPFPIRSKNDITQSLSVFDYDSNGKYRFLMVNDNKVTMYDKRAKKVRGFKYRKAEAGIKYPIKHIRMGNKDYIVVQDEDDNLEILNRRGKTRVALPESFKHSGGEWFEYKGKFVSLNDDGKLVFVDENGGIDIKNYDWINPKFEADPKTLVCMSENRLSIENNKAELPYGLYSEPMLTSKYAAISDRQDQKVYVFDKNAELLNGFPVYGKEIVDLYYTQKRIVLLVLDEKGAIMVYKANLN